MQLVGVAMVRNEADVVEAFVRHNLRTLDRLLVVDHRSDDGTRDILAALVREGLPLVVEHEEGAAQRQSEVTTRLARAAFAAGADVVLPVDADEFLKVPSRAALERVLRSVPASLCGALAWQTYVPEADTEPAGDAFPTLRRRRATEAHGLQKVVLTRAFGDAPAAVVGYGNHTVLMSGPGHDLARMPVRLGLLPASIAALAHLPVRSAAQIMRKVAVGWAAYQTAVKSDAALVFHWRELVEAFARDGRPDERRLREIAVNYGVPMARWVPADDVELVVDPVPIEGERRHAALARTDAAAAP